MQLTSREYEVAGLIAKDLSQKMIADELFISPGTVHKHNSNIRKKWNVKTSVGIAVRYLQTLDSPKQFVLASMFLVIQGFMVLTGTEMEARKPVRVSNRVVKVRKDVS